MLCRVSPARGSCQPNVTSLGKVVLGFLLNELIAPGVRLPRIVGFGARRKVARHVGIYRGTKGEMTHRLHRRSSKNARRWRICFPLSQSQSIIIVAMLGPFVLCCKGALMARPLWS